MNQNYSHQIGYASPSDVNIFSGAGGLALGLMQAGFEPTEFYDKDPGACSTLIHNLQRLSSPLHGRVFQSDVSQMDWLRLGPDIRLLAAGTPCQPFSMGGSRRGADDSRNLFPELLKAVSVLRPVAVLIENVRGLDRGQHKQYLDYVIRQLSYIELTRRPAEKWQDHDSRLLKHASTKTSHLSYRVKWAVLNSADYGVAQIRHRLFLVATQPNLPEYQFPKPTHSRSRLVYQQARKPYWEERGLPIPDIEVCRPAKDDDVADLLPWTTVRDAVNDLPPLHYGKGEESNNHCFIPGARPYSGHSGSRLDWPSKTVKAGVHGVPGGENTMVCDDGSLRYYSMREMARIQSFPDHHYFPGARSNVTRQIGNAVPCGLAKAVARPLHDILSQLPVG